MTKHDYHLITKLHKNNSNTRPTSQLLVSSLDVKEKNLNKVGSWYLGMRNPRMRNPWIWNAD